MVSLLHWIGSFGKVCSVSVLYLDSASLILPSDLCLPDLDGALPDHGLSGLPWWHQSPGANPSTTPSPAWAPGGLDQVQQHSGACCLRRKIRQMYGKAACITAQWEPSEDGHWNCTRRECIWREGRKDYGDKPDLGDPVKYWEWHSLKSEIAKANGKRSLFLSSSPTVSPRLSRPWVKPSSFILLQVPARKSPNSSGPVLSTFTSSGSNDLIQTYSRSTWNHFCLIGFHLPAHELMGFAWFQYEVISSSLDSQTGSKTSGFFE